MKYNEGDIVLVDPNTEFKFSGKVVKIIRVKQHSGCIPTYEVSLVDDEFSRSTYRETNLLPASAEFKEFKKEKETNKMKIEGFKRVVSVAHLNPTPYDSNLPTLALYDYDNMTEQDIVGKLVVAKTWNNGIVMYRVKAVYNADDVEKLNGEVIEIVDTTAFDTREANRKKKAELMKKMDTMIAAKSEMDKYEKYAQLFPEIAEVLNEYKSI